jgi:ferric-dicitrate binding protein FerR (iron transport regulator)
MNVDWRELLQRVLDGEPLSEADAARLHESLRHEEDGREAIGWLQFETTIGQHLQPKNPEKMARSRERLLAKAVLREKHRAVVGHTPTRRFTTPGLVAIAVAVSFLLAVCVGWLLLPRGYRGPQAGGDYRLLRAEATEGPATPLERGTTLVSGVNGARLELGDYCSLRLDPDTEVTVLGQPRKEAIQLHRGEIRARVEPGEGEFTLVTPLGPVEVEGTEFVTTVEYPDLLEGESAMSSRTTRVVVTVAVLTGAVMCHLSDSPTALRQGMNRAFAGQRDGTKGVVVSITDFTATLKLDSGEQVVFHAPKSKQLTVREVSQLVPGDEISVAWIEEEGKKWIQEINGRGTVEGVVTGLGDRWIEVTAEGRRAAKFIPPWRGGNPSEGGGLDKEVLKKLGRVRVGNRVLLTWEMPEGKRVVDVKVLEPRGREESESDAEKSQSDLPQGAIPAGLRGFKGILFGKIAEKNDDKGTFVLEVRKVGRVWKQNRAENAEAAVGKALPIELHRESRLRGQHQETLQKLSNGDMVEVEVFHVRDGVLSVIELLRKVE